MCSLPPQRQGTPTERFGDEGVKIGCPRPARKNHRPAPCDEGESLDTAYGPTGFSAFMRPRANMYVARCVLGCIVWMCIIK